MVTAGDVSRWIEEGEPALRGGFVHRVWRTPDAWVLLIRHHEEGDPEARATSRVALEVALAADWARCVALPPEDVDADDKKLKKAWARDSHPFLSLLRKHLGGAQVVGLNQVQGDRLLQLRCDHPAGAEAEESARRLMLAIELAGRSGNLILTRLDDDERPLVLGSLFAGRAKRPFERGLPYRPPPPRPDSALADAEPEVCPDVDPDPETLALGRAVAALQRERAEEAERESRQGVLRRGVKKALKRAQGVLKKLESQLAEVDRADEFEAQADLIKANLDAIPRGAKTVTVTDYAAEGGPAEVELTLDPSKDVHDQMKALYKRARKLRSGESSIRMRQGETDAQLEELRDLLERVDAVDPEDEAALDALEAEARKRKALPKAKPAKVKQQQNQGPRSYLTKEGHEVLVGRSDDENDRLTMRIARGRDLFFHVAGCPGSHVILRVDPKRPPNHESLVDAATVAVHFSKARNRGAAVDVHYTPRKWVKKPKGAKPGLVTISNFKTVRAGNDPARLKRVLDTARRDEET